MGNEQDEVTTEEANVIDLSNSYWGDEKVLEILHRVRGANFPTKLNLAGNRLEVSGAKQLAEMLRANQTLTSVSLEWNNVGLLDQGIEAIAEAMEVNTTLTELDLRNNNIGPEGAKALGAALRRNKTLRNLDLRWNGIGNSGTLALVEALHLNESLLRLEIAGNNNTSVSHNKELETLLERNRSLEQQKLKKRPMDDQLVIDLLTEKETLEQEVHKLRKQLLRMTETHEQEQQQSKSAQKELVTMVEERNRCLQRESDVKKETHELKMRLDELENRRKLEFEDYRSTRASLERENNSYRDKMNQVEASHAKELDQKLRMINQLEEAKYEAENELHRLKSLNRAQQEEIEQLHGLQQVSQRDSERREQKLISEYEASRVSAQRQHDATVNSLQSQLEYVTRINEENQRLLISLRDKNESLQSALLQLKAAHERDIVERKNAWESDCHNRVQRAVSVVEEQLEAARNARVQLETEMHAQAQLLGQIQREKLDLQQNATEQHLEATRQIEQLQKENQREKENAGNERRRVEDMRQKLLKQLEDKDQEISRVTKSSEERLQEQMARRTAEYEVHIKSKNEKISQLESNVVAFENRLDAQSHDHDLRIDRLGETLREFIHDQIKHERELTQKA